MIRRFARCRGRPLLAAGLLLGLLCGTQTLAAEPAYVDVWGPPVGSRLPVLEAPDHNGALRTLENLAGREGLLLFLNRSADW